MTRSDQLAVSKGDYFTEDQRRLAWRRVIEAAAIAESNRVLEKAGAGLDIYSHQFTVGDRQLLLSTYTQPPLSLAQKSKGNTTQLLPARRIIEVSQAPKNLTGRTILRPRPNSSRVGTSKLEAAE